MKLTHSLIHYLKTFPFYAHIRYHPIIERIHQILIPEIKEVLDTEFQFYNLVIPKEKINLAFDIGASIGNNTKHLRRLGIKVIAVEPEKTNFRILRNRFRKDSGVVVVRNVVSETMGVSKLFVEKGNSLHTVNEKWLKAAPARSSHKVVYTGIQEVQSITINDLFQQYGIPNLIKIDVEGNELKVIKSIGQPIDFILFEANLPEYYSETLKIIELLDGYQFQVYHLKKDGYTLLGNETCLSELNEISVEIFAQKAY
ncbi:FkbM family methyltransferase [Portibacter marinus]|uniref:FkbM family methyltransferase n=1 Tax=Portibacter marinus TaxID=2898660 RepID=UPI001F00B0DF|nr:FkbM family methyltransferase [Portibacter marinus]